MRVLLFIQLLLSFGAVGQTLSGVVVDATTGMPLYPVTIVNITTQKAVNTDEQGNYRLPVSEGDKVSFSFIGYHTLEVTATPPFSGQKVELAPLSVQLKEFILHPDYTPFQKDSAAMATLYSTELSKQPVKAGFSSANGGGFTGLIGAPVQKMSKSYKQNKKFKANYKQDMEQKFIDTRYTRGLVTALTGYTGDTLSVFMNSYPMDYSFCRAASDLEIKMWIRSNYREYLKPQAPKAASSTLPKN